MTLKEFLSLAFGGILVLIVLLASLMVPLAAAKYVFTG